MSSQAKFLAADLGASSGRVMVGQWSSSRFTLEKLYRFPNGGVSVADGPYWNVLGVRDHLQAGMTKYRTRFHDSPQGIGVDAWGVDFGLLDQCGRLVGNPVRDRRTHCSSCVGGEGLQRFFRSK